MGHPGRFVTDPNAQGERVLLTPPEGATLYRFGDEDTAEGSRPFVAAVDLETGTSRRLWQSAGSVYEEPRFLLDAGGARLITRRETPEEPPNFILHSLDSGAERPLTAFANPHPALSAPPREVIRAGGEGGKTIRGLLARPAAADSAGPPPLLLWIRPSEPGGGAVSPYRFEPSGPASPFVWATQGFAVLVVSDLPVSEDAAAPAEPPAGSFVNAALAMVDTATGKWGADRRRVAVGGDGDGAAAVPVFLARDPRFRAGIASGGAYNPAFKWPGFEDKEPIPVLASGVSEGNSSLRLAFSRPLLLLQGEADADRARNAERSFGALTGLDAPARLVLFPHERAPLRARESILHALWETREWLLAHVANSGPGSRNSGKP
jgi:dipeptidyl aminopeptidase/acylaminoacyl peptidase